jgi:hypothetical protein
MVRGQHDKSTIQYAIVLCFDVVVSWICAATKRVSTFQANFHLELDSLITTKEYYVWYATLLSSSFNGVATRLSISASISIMMETLAHKRGRTLKNLAEIETSRLMAPDNVGKHDCWFVLS